MPEPQLRQHLSKVAIRFGRLWMWQRLTRLWIVLSVLLVVWTAVGQPIVPVWSWFFSAGLVSAFVWLRSRFILASTTDVARRVEQAFPDLNARLLAALEQIPDARTGRFDILQRQVISESMHHARMNDWSDSVPNRQMRRAFLGQLTAFVAFIVIALSVQFHSESVAAVSKFNSVADNMTNRIPVTVEPGDATLERGTSVLVLARFSSKPPADVYVVWNGSDQIEHQLPLTKSLDDPVFATRLPPLKEDITYRIEFDGQQTPNYKINVYDLPALVRSDLILTYPSYTNLPDKTLEDAFEATVVEGSLVRINCLVNKEIASAKLIAADGVALDLIANSIGSKSHSIQFSPTKPMRMKLELIDESGRKNRDPEEFRIDVVPNRVPELTLTFPGKDVKVSPLEEVQIEATTIDDFGILEAGLVVQIAGRDPVTIPLCKDLKPSERHLISSIERLEDSRVQPDELITYYLYAIDFGPDGQKRQTDSDVFFAEVRSFDEIYRQIDQKSPLEVQSQQKPPDSLGKLIELQRKIIVATWKLARTTSTPWSAKSAEELTTIRESQQQALEKLEDLRSRMTQPQLQPIFSTITEAMEKALNELGRSLSETRFQPLRSAVAAEQASYQGLLKLRTKEHLLVQAQGTGNAPDPEEKLDLELKHKKDRYESEKAGTKKEESNVNREALAILDRLNELSRRQEGINQQIKDLEARMRQAKTDAERDDVERQLKRLREEQQQLLHDADELRNKLNNSLQQELVTATREKLEQTRQQMVDTSEKLREGQLSQALNSGTRAERDLKQLSDDFRKQTAAQFADALRTLRDEARRLAEREIQLGEQLNHLGDGPRHSLRESQERSLLQAEFQQQRQQANEIVEKAKQVVEQAESPEPLLSKQLYDTLRSTRELKLEQAFAATQQLLKQGIIPEASKAEQQVQKGIDRLKQGIEKAAESVLGNEVDSLKRARHELAELSEALDKEIQAQGQAGSNSNPSPAGKSHPGKGEANDPTSETGDGSKGTKQPGKSNSSNQSQQTADAGTASSPGDQSPNGREGTSSSGDASGSGETSGSSEANANSSGSAAEGNAPSNRPSQSGLRSRKPAGNTRPTPGREGLGGEDSGSGGTSGNGQGGGPLTGSQFTEFNERLRDVESMVSDPQLQAEVQKVRDRARSVRAEFKRHTNTPNWELVRTSVHQPMLELQQKLSDEIAKRESPDSLVPVDRDPVPTRYRDLVRMYYEQLGAGKND